MEPIIFKKISSNRVIGYYSGVEVVDIMFVYNINDNDIEKINQIFEGLKGVIL